MMAAMVDSGWFGVRCVFMIGAAPNAVYEERVTVWRAVDADEAIRLAESEAARYAAAIDATFLGLAQSYTMADEPGEGAEVFSLMRSSTLGPAEYLDAFFDTGHERQRRTR